MNPNSNRTTNIMKSKKKARKSLLPPIEKVKTVSASGLSIMFDDDNILIVIDKQYYNRTFFVKDEGIYTVRLGVFRNMDKGALEESAIFCTIPTKADCEQQITAMFDIPEASARFMDTVILECSGQYRSCSNMVCR